MKNYTDILQDLVKKSCKQGATAAEAMYVEGEGVSVTIHDKQLENLERHEGHDLGLRIVIDGKQAIGSTTDLSTNSLSRLIEQTISMAKHLPADPYCVLGSPDQLIKDIPDVDSYDSTEVKTDTLIQMAKECEEATLSVEGVSTTEEIECSWSKSKSILVSSNGFLGEKKGSSTSLVSVSIAGTFPGMQTDYDYDSAIYLKDLKSPSLVGKQSGERAVKRLNSKKVETGNFPIIFDPRVGSGLLGSFAQAVNGISVARGKSFLKDSLGQKIFNDCVTVIDNPLIKRGKRSRPFDAEGLPTKAIEVIKEGVLTTWIMNLSAAKQLKMKSTGSASRTPGSLPMPSVSNFYIQPGISTPKDVIKSINKGFFVTEVMGNGINLITGDYSMGASGFWIENGEIVYPISEASIAGNLKDMFKNMVPCSDLDFRYGIDVPTLLIEGMTTASQ